MKTIVAYTDIRNNQEDEILVKEYNSFDKAYIPEEGKVITVYSELEHDHIDFKVLEVRTLIDREFDHFDVLLERTN